MEAKKLVFGPLIRVSTEAQAKQGESLNTQKKQLEAAIESLGGKVYQWYAGQEHATADHERKILESLMSDAAHKKFDAVMVADISRWSRDNGKSKDYISKLKENGIKFFVGTREMNLYDPTQSFMLGMSVEVAEFFAREQAYKSIMNRIERARQGFPSCGKKPYGRIFDKETKQWAVDETAKQKIEEIARLYLEEDIQFAELGKRFGMNSMNLHKILTKRSGETWEQRFQNKACGIDETVVTIVPRLLEEDIVFRIRDKCEARKKWDHASQKYAYLFSRLIFDADTGYALTGTPNRHGRRYYRPYRGKGYLYMINADLLEKAVTEVLFEALSTDRAMIRAVFDGQQIDKISEGLRVKKNTLDKELQGVEKKLSNLRKAILSLEDTEGVKVFVDGIKQDIRALEERQVATKRQIAGILERLSSRPTEREVADRRRRIQQELMRRVAESYFRSGHMLQGLPFKDKRALLKLIFGGRDENNDRYGIYVKCLGGQPRRFKFEAYGRLGNLEGWITGGRGQQSSFCDGEVYKAGDSNMTQEMAKIVGKADPQGSVKQYVCSERHAHHGVRLRQRR